MSELRSALSLRCIGRQSEIGLWSGHRCNRTGRDNLSLLRGVSTFQKIREFRLAGNDGIRFRVVGALLQSLKMREFEFQPFVDFTLLRRQPGDDVLSFNVVIGNRGGTGDFCR